MVQGDSEVVAPRGRFGDRPVNFLSITTPCASEVTSTLGIKVLARATAGDDFQFQKS